MRTRTTRRWESGELLEDALEVVSSDAQLDGNSSASLGPEPDVDSLWNLLFTSGTSSAPKAVRCTQRRLLTTGNRLSMLLDVGPDDVGYIAMPLFHSNSLMVGLAPALVVGRVGRPRQALQRLAFPGRRSPLRGDVVQLHRQATRVSARYAREARRRRQHSQPRLRERGFTSGRRVCLDAVRSRGGRRFRIDRGSDRLRQIGGTLPEDRSERCERTSPSSTRTAIRCRWLSSTPTGRLVNADVCVGEIVNTAGVGPFEGYYKNEEAMAATTRRGWYWSGDLGYIDADGWVYFAGRTADWLRVDGENFPAGPIDAVVGRHPDVLLGAVYGVPDVFAGDQVMVALVLSGRRRVRPGQTSPRGSGAAGPVAQVAPSVREDQPCASADALQQGAHAGPAAREVPLGPHGGETPSSRGPAESTATT